MAINLARMGSIAPASDGFSYDPSDEARKIQIARDLRKKEQGDRLKAAQDLESGKIDLASKALAQRELERTTGEAEKARGIRSGFIVNREGALDVPVGIRSPEFVDNSRPSNAPFGPLGAPEPRNRVESQATIDLARVNPDFAEAFRTGNITERNSETDRKNKIAAEEQKGILAGAKNTAEIATEQSRKAAIDAKPRADGNRTYVLSRTGGKGGSATGDGSETPTDPNAKPPKPPTEMQANFAIYGRRLQQANDIINGLYDQGFDRSKASQGVLSKTANFLGFKSNELLKQEQAERNFVNATLRRESGAAISRDEFLNAEKQYFPRTGDSPGVIEQKKRNRETQLQSFKGLAGPAWEKAGGDVQNPYAIPTFKTDAEADAAGLKPGTKVIVGGREGVWYP